MISIGTLNDISGIRHGFFTRIRGFSEGIYASNNCGYGSGDDPKKVTANRDRTMRRMDMEPGDLVTVHQHHSADVVRVDQRWAADEAPKADAMVTTRPRIALGILTADCAPVLLSTRKPGVIGAVHAGWKGALGGVIGNTIAAMTGEGADASDIVAVVGPCIKIRSYEVGDEFYARFIEDQPENNQLFSPGRTRDKWMFDLAGYVERRLLQAGVGEVFICPHDTYREADRFFSARRALHMGEEDYGRLLSVIAIEHSTRKA